jgi:3'-5' exoribonuclease
MGISKKQFISDLRIGVKVDSVFMVAAKQIRKKKNGEDYCTVVLQDRDGSIEGVIWTEIYRSTDNFERGDFVLVEGDVGGYKGGRQLTITSLKKIEDRSGIEQSDYIKVSKKDIDLMFGEIKEYIGKVKNPYARKLLDSFFCDKSFVKVFKDSTAAVQYHHAFKGGLLEHTLSVVKICNAAFEIYEGLNYDLLISGAILHDIGKMREYRTTVTTEVTDEGKLIGHITIGYGQVLEKIKQIKDFPEDLKNRLLHIILSHHGHKEFGSPKRPKILEAFIVYHADHLDADIGGYSIALEENRSGNDWSDYVKNFERSVLLKKLELNDKDESSGEDELSGDGYNTGTAGDVENGDTGKIQDDVRDKDRKGKPGDKDRGQDELF